MVITRIAGAIANAILVFERDRTASQASKFLRMAGLGEGDCTLVTAELFWGILRIDPSC